MKAQNCQGRTAGIFGYVGMLLLGVMVFLASCKPIPPPTCQPDSRLCPDGSTVGRVPPDCRFAACKETKGPTAGTCRPEQAKAQYCMELFDPVCGNDNTTYGNACFACKAMVRSWTKGPCAP